MRRIQPGPPAELTEDELRASYAYPTDHAWVRGNMVATLDGAIHGSDGLAKSITTPSDQRVFGLARMASDVILVGAGTVRAEDYRPSKRTVAVVTSRLDVPLSLRMFADRTDANPRPIVVTTEESAPHATDELLEAADVVACGVDRVDLAAAIAHLVARGLPRILCEGGPTLLGNLIEARLLDELLLTVSPLLVGAEPDAHIVNIPGGLQPARRFRTTGVLEEDGTVFLRMLAA